MQEVNASNMSVPGPQQSLHKTLRRGAQTLLAQAIEAEVTVWINEHQHLLDAQGRHQVVRNGHLSERKIVTGLGQVSVEQSRVRDRRPPERFSSQLFPPYLRKTKSIEVLIPYLSVKSSALHTTSLENRHSNAHRFGTIASCGCTGRHAHADVAWLSLRVKAGPRSTFFERASSCDCTRLQS